VPTIERRKAEWLRSERLRSVLLLLVPGAGAVYLAFQGGGAAAGFAAIVAVGFATALLLRVQAAPVDAALVARLAEAGLLAVPGALVLYLSFQAGGFFPGSTAFAAICLLLLLVLRITLADDPLASFGRALGAVTLCLGAYLGWILLSASWSDGTARTLLDFDKALVCVLTLVLMGTLPRSSDRLRGALRGVALAIVVVGVAGLVTRVLPDVFPAAPNIANRRLAFPLTYWNALAALVTVGIVLCLHLTSSLREHWAARALAAAAIPALAATVFFTFSRGAVAAGIVGVVLYPLLGRPRGMVTAALAVIPTALIAVNQAYAADLLATDNPTTSAATSQGHHVALVVLLCALAAATIRTALLPVDRRVMDFRLPEDLRRPVTATAWAGSALAAVVIALALGAPSWASTQVDRFVHTASVKTGGDYRKRFLDPSNNGRIEHWRVAREGFRAHPVHGDGAGTYGTRWMHDRKPAYAGLVVRDAHSLYLEVADELGLVGLVLLGAAILTALAATLPVRRGYNRSLYAALFAASMVWVVHSAVDWDWEMPATSVWFFALAGMALAVHRSKVTPRPFSQGARVALGVVLLAAALAPGAVLVSERHLSAAADAFQEGDCNKAMREASASIEALALRPEPYEALGYCQIRRGTPLLAPAAMRKAVENDPDDWEYWYSYALALGAAGRDPLPAALRARSLNPRDELTTGLVRDLRRAGPRERQRLTTALGRTERLSVVR
jgi:O-antigen ligase